jgi:hypothetical protein
MTPETIRSKANMIIKARKSRPRPSRILILLTSPCCKSSFEPTNPITPVKPFKQLSFLLTCGVILLMGCTKSSPSNVSNNNASSGLSFNVKIVVNITRTSNLYNDVYSDSAIFEVDIANGQVAISHIQNYPPNVSPPNYASGNTSAMWIPDGIGVINITSASGLVDQTGNISLSLNESASVNPKWQVTQDGTTTISGGEPLPGILPVVVFKDEDVDQQVLNSSVPQTQYTIYVNPIH